LNAAVLHIKRIMISRRKGFKIITVLAIVILLYLFVYDLRHCQCNGNDENLLCATTVCNTGRSNSDNGAQQEADKKRKFFTLFEDFVHGRNESNRLRDFVNKNLLLFPRASSSGSDNVSNEKNIKKKEIEASSIAGNKRLKQYLTDSPQTRKIISDKEISPNVANSKSLSKSETEKIHLIRTKASKPLSSTTTTSPPPTTTSTTATTEATPQTTTNTTATTATTPQTTTSTTATTTTTPQTTTKTTVTTLKITATPVPPTKEKLYQTTPASSIAVIQQKCHIPKLDPFHREVKPFIKYKWLHSHCEIKQDKCSIENGYLLMKNITDVEIVKLNYITRVSDYDNKLVSEIIYNRTKETLTGLFWFDRVFFLQKSSNLIYKINYLI